MATPFSASIRNSVVCLFLALPFIHAMQAQTAQFSGAITTLGSGFNYPASLAVDASGNVFVADALNSAMYEIVAVGGVVSSTSTVNTIGGGFNSPQGVTVDASGNVFVADFNNNAVKEIVAVGGLVSSSSVVNTIGSGFSNPGAVAVDPSGNVFVADTNHNAVKEIVAVGGLVSSSSVVNTIGSGFNNPQGIALDASGNVFVSDTGNNLVKEIVAVGGLVSSSSTVNTIGSGFVFPEGLAVDASGDVFVADRLNHTVSEIVAVNGIVSSSSTVAMIGGGFSSPYGVALDRGGNFYVADSGHQRVLRLQPYSVNFGSLPVATSTPTTISLVFTFATGGTIGVPAALTQGATGLDFADAGTGTCTTNGTSHSYSAGGSCTVDVTFTPKWSGVRYGAVTLSSSGTMIATGSLQGTGLGPQLTFSPGTLSAVGSGFNGPGGAAVDGAGDVFVADQNNNAVKEILAVNGAVSSSSTVNTVGSGFNSPYSVTVDGAGNVFVADYGNNAVKKIVAVNGAVSSSSTVATVGNGFNGPNGVAVDGAGNVFVADYANNAVKEIIAVNGTVSSSSTVNTVGSSFNGPSGVAVDGSGNVFVADYTNNAVKEIAAVNGAVSSSSTVNTLGSGFSNPAAVAVDAAGDVFVADYRNNAVKEIVAVNGAVSSSSTVDTLGSGFSSPGGVAVDGVGNVFVADQNNNAVKEIDVADAPSLSFASTAVGSTSSDSPQTVTVTNNGNAPLTFEVPSTGLNPSISANFTFGNSSTCPQLSTSSSTATLAAGASCTNLISFMPTASGSITGSLVVTDNAFNAAGPSYTTQTVSLSGTATSVPLSASTTVASAALTEGHAATTFTPVNASGGTGTLTYSVTPALPAGLVFSSTGTVSGTPTAVSAATTYTVTVTDANSATATATFSLTVNAALRTSTTVDSKVLTEGNAATTFTPITGSGGTGTLTYSISPALPTGLAFSATGAVSGTPTLVSAATNYMVTVTDANGATRSASFSLTVKSAVTATTVSSSTVLTAGHAAAAFNPVTASGGTGTLRYSVTPALPAALTFSSTGTVSGTPTAVSTATTYTVTVTDANGATATSTFSLTVNAAITTSTTTSSTVLTVGHVATAFAPVTASGGTGTLTYSVSPALPAGLVFASTGLVSGTPTVVNAATTYTVTVTDTNSATSTATFSLTVNAAVTTITAVASTVLAQGHLAAAFTPVTASGGTGALTYSVSPALPAGLVFVSTGAVSGTPTAVSAATTYTVTVTDTNGATSTATFSLTVNNVTVTTSTAVTSSSLTPTYGAMVVLTAKVTPAPVDTPPGTARFYTGSTLLGTVALNSTGVATLSIALPLGPNAITAVYSGSASDAGSTSSALSVSDRTGTSVTFSASPTTQLYNNPIVLTAQATSATAGILTGTVSFLDGTIVIATVPLGANGQATYSVATLADGSHSLTAAYSGDSSFQPSGSTGAAVAITVGDVNLNLGGGQNQSVVPGAAVAYTFPLSPLVTPTFLYDVHLTATGLPQGATYTFSPATIPAGSGSMPVTLTVQTAKGTASLSMPAAPGRNSWRGPTALAFGLLLPLLGAKRVRRRLKAMPRPLAMVLFIVLSMGAMVGMTGCGGGGFYGATSTSGKYTITVTATSADLVRVSTVQLTIQ